jgi:hypothetical protein
MKKCILMAILLVLFSIPSANAISINYKANDLGSELWQFDYYVSDFDFDADYGFQVFYEYGLYESITPVSSPSDWDVLAYDPDSIFGAPVNGAYDALALVDGASLSESFSVQFRWLGAGDPNGQYFEVYDPTFAYVDSGQTAPVPEPATFLLFSAGLAGLGLRKRFKK